MSDYLYDVNRPLPSAAPLSSISLFSGILGIDIGLGRVGFATQLALDIDPAAKDVVEDNRSSVGVFPYLREDITKVSGEELLALAGCRQGQLDLLTGGPPCQPFSKSGLRSGVRDERGQLFRHYLNLVESIKPRAFLLENVRGLYSSNGGKDFQQILEHFDATGYTVYWAVKDAANYGVPQFRQRIFFVGFRDRIEFRWPNETHSDPPAVGEFPFDERLPLVTVQDALRGLESDDEAPRFSGAYAHLLKDIPEGLNYSHYTKERGHTKPVFKWRSKYWYFLLKIDRARPSLTIQAHPGNNTGPFHWDNRRLSIRELLRLQGFPDWFHVRKPYTVAHRLIGNAVPPLLAERLGDCIRGALDSERRISHAEFLRQRLVGMAVKGYVKSGRGSGKGRKESGAL